MAVHTAGRIQEDVLEVLGVVLTHALDSRGEPPTPSMLSLVILDGTRKEFPTAMEMEELVVTPSTTRDTTGDTPYGTPVTSQRVQDKPNMRQ